MYSVALSAFELKHTDYMQCFLAFSRSYNWRHNIPTKNRFDLERSIRVAANQVIENREKFQEISIHDPITWLGRALDRMVFSDSIRKSFARNVVFVYILTWKRLNLWISSLLLSCRLYNPSRNWFTISSSLTTKNSPNEIAIITIMVIRTEILKKRSEIKYILKKIVVFTHDKCLIHLISVDKKAFDYCKRRKNCTKYHENVR